MFTPLITLDIPMPSSIRSSSQSQPRRLQASQLVALALLFVGGQILSNYWVTRLLNQFFGG